MKTQFLTLDGVQYNIDEFSHSVAQLVTIYNRFMADLQDNQLELMKTQAAISQITAQLTEQMKLELEQRNANDNQNPA